ncbi:MAG TPA: hypothetical protein VMT64_11220 [Candidatus Binataceae bacterium]|nr:hypothetical protein [Candidatus Binataceae bacterium]
MRCEVPVASVIAILLAGCAPQQPYLVSPQISNPSSQTEAVSAQEKPTPAATLSSSSNDRAAPTRVLPYKGRLVDTDPSEIPPAIAAALAKDAPLTFTYREELTHDEYHLPMLFSALDPVTYFGSPLGDYGVTASATLTISEGDRVIADYTAKAHVQKSYNLYSEPKHSELERAARDAVRARIDEKLFVDADRVSHALVTE